MFIQLRYTDYETDDVQIIHVNKNYIRSFWALHKDEDHDPRAKTKLRMADDSYLYVENTVDDLLNQLSK